MRNSLKNTLLNTFLAIPILLGAKTERVCAVTSDWGKSPLPQVLKEPNPEFKEAKLWLEQLGKRQREAKSFLLRFEAEGFDAEGEKLTSFKGSLLSGDSGRFRLEYSKNLIVCDGKTLWQYFSQTRQLILRNAQDAKDSKTAGGILLRYLHAQPLQAKRVPQGLQIMLDAKSSGENLDSLTLLLDDKNHSVIQVETVDPTGTRLIYIVKTLKLEAKVRPKDFEAPKPSGAEIVDMR